MPSALKRACCWSACACMLRRPLAGVLQGQGGGDDEDLAHAAAAARPPGPSGPGAGRSAAGPGGGRPASAVPPRRAPSSSSSWTPAATLRRSGGSTNGKSAISPSPSEVICRMTLARLVRRISGSVNSGRPSKSSSAYSRIAMPGRDPPAAAGALVGRGLADRLDRQPLHLGAHRVARDAGDAGVDDVADAGDGQRGLGDVGGQHDAAPGVRGEDAVLLGRARAGSRAARPRCGRRRPPRGRRRCRGSPARRAGRPGCRRGPRRTARGTASTIGLGLVADDGLALVVVLGQLHQRAVADLDRVGAPGDLDDGGVEVLRRTARGRSWRW